jgi:hypothetical protein
LPAGWVSRDVGMSRQWNGDAGEVGFAGSTSLSGSTYSLSGSGNDIWGTADSFQYAYRGVSGDCTVVARVASVQGSDGWTKAGLMVRETLQFDSANALAALTPQNGTYFSYRSATSVSSSGSSSSGSAPYWLKLVRSGNTLTGYRGPNPSNWTQISTTTIPMAANVFVGLALTARNNLLVSTAVFDNVSVSCQLPPAPVSLTATAGDVQVALEWSAVTGANTYILKRSTTNNGPYTVIATGLSGTNYLDAGVTNGVTYYYVVSTFNLNGEGTNSAQASATPQPAVPAAPTGLAALGGVGAVALTWNASALAANYYIKRALTFGGPYTNTITTTTATSFEDTNVINETTYFYVVSAASGGGESANSSGASATPHAPPRLAATLGPGGSQITFSWPGWAGSFYLFAATNLVPTAQWLPVTNAVVPGDPITVVVPMEGEMQFFRLIEQ